MTIDMTVDSIEEDFAVCEDFDEKVHFIEVSRLPDGVKEGYVLTVFDDGTVKVNVIKTEERRNEILKLQKKLFDK